MVITATIFSKIVALTKSIFLLSKKIAAVTKSTWKKRVFFENSNFWVILPFRRCWKLFAFALGWVFVLSLALSFVNRPCRTGAIKENSHKKSVAHQDVGFLGKQFWIIRIFHFYYGINKEKSLNFSKIWKRQKLKKFSKISKIKLFKLWKFWYPQL